MDESLKVKDARTLINKEPTMVKKDATIKEVAKKILENPKTRSVYVVNENDELVGIIPVLQLVQYLYYKYIPLDYIIYRFSIIVSSDSKAEEIMLPPEYVHDDDPLETAVIKMFKNNLKELPVVDNNMHIVGEINILELISIWLKEHENAA